MRFIKKTKKKKTFVLKSKKLERYVVGRVSHIWEILSVYFREGKVKQKKPFCRLWVVHWDAGSVSVTPDKEDVTAASP